MSLSTTAPRTDQRIEEKCSPYCVLGVAPAATSLSLNYLLLLQNQALQQVAEQNVQIASLISRISRAKARVKSEASESESKTEDPRSLRLVLSEDLHTPILKERGFALTGVIKDTDGRIVPEAAGVRLIIALFTQDKPAKALELNIAGITYTGKKALRGTLTAEVDTTGSFCFPNVVINEVSSHYIDDVFTLVVSDLHDEMRPLVIRRLSVRARKAKCS